MVARRRKRIAQRKKARNGKRIQSNKPFISHLPNHIRRRLFFSSHSPSSHSHAHSSSDCHTQEEPIFLFTNVLPAFLKYSLFFVCLPRKSPNCDTLLSKPSLQMPSVWWHDCWLEIGLWTGKNMERISSRRNLGRIRRVHWHFRFRFSICTATVG